MIILCLSAAASVSLIYMCRHIFDIYVMSIISKDVYTVAILRALLMQNRFIEYDTIIGWRRVLGFPLDQIHKTRRDADEQIKSGCF